MDYEIERNKFKGFKLLSLELRENSLMGKSNLHYNFLDDTDNLDTIYTTVIIGANGTGKSNYKIVDILHHPLSYLNHITQTLLQSQFSITP